MLLVLLAVWNLLQAPSGHWALVHTGAAESRRWLWTCVENVWSVLKKTNLDPSGVVVIKNPGKKNLRMLSSAITQTVSCDHINNNNNNKSSRFCLINMFQVNSTVFVIVQHGSWLGNLREIGRLSCGFRPNVDHEVHLKAQNKSVSRCSVTHWGNTSRNGTTPSATEIKCWWLRIDMKTTCGALLHALVARCVALLLYRLICVLGWVQTSPLQTLS